VAQKISRLAAKSDRRNPSSARKREQEYEPKDDRRSKYGGGQKCGSASATQHPDAFAKALPALCNLGFSKQRAANVLAELRERPVEHALEPILRAALAALVPGPE
jgi:Holliday junction resolvasome RuvABC DNA-binding subunit